MKCRIKSDGICFGIRKYFVLFVEKYLSKFDVNILSLKDTSHMSYSLYVLLNLVFIVLSFISNFPSIASINFFKKSLSDC